MAQIIKLPVREDVGEVEHREFFNRLAEKTDQLVYMSKDKEGNYLMGHTPLEVGDLMFMSYHLHKLIEHTIAEHYEG